MVVRVLLGILVLEVVILGSLWVPPWLAAERYVISTARFDHRKVIKANYNESLILLSNGECLGKCEIMVAFANHIDKDMPSRVQASLILEKASGVNVRASNDDMTISYCTGRVVHYEYPFFQRRGGGNSVNVRLMQACHAKME